MPEPEIDPELLRRLKDFKPDDAIAFFRGKGYEISWDWTDTLEEAKQRAFTVTKAMNLDLLQTIRDEVDKALTDGLTYEQFEKNLAPRLKQKGWWGKQPLTNPKTGETEEVLTGSPYRLKQIYQNNLQQAYMAGRWQGIEAAKAFRPYAEYIAVLDGRTSAICNSLNGKVFRIDDEFWTYFTPPNHFGCRSRMRSLDKDDLLKLKLPVTRSAGRIGEQETPIKGGGSVVVKTYTDAKGNRLVPSPGFDRNPTATSNYIPPPEKYNADLYRKYREAFEDGITKRYFSGNATVDIDGDRLEFKEFSKRFFGKILTDKEITRLAGAPDGSRIKVLYSDANGVTLDIENDFYIETSTRTISKEIGSGKLVIYNENLRLKDTAPEAFGLRIFATEVRQAAALSIDHIQVLAGGNQGGNMNGYYTWARYGFEARIPNSVLRNLPASLQKSETILDLFETEEGRRWWETFGRSVLMIFDLTQESRSLSVLEKCLLSKAISI